MEQARRVVIGTAPVGVNFGVIGTVADARTGERLAETEMVGHGNTGRARRDAEALAADRGWVVADEDA